MLAIRIALGEQIGTLKSAIEGFGGAPMTEFIKEAGRIAVEHVRAIMGTDELGMNTDTHWYETKTKRKGFTSVPGKTALQPLIFSTALYDAIIWRRSGNGVSVGLLPRDSGGRFVSYSDPEAEYGYHTEDSRVMLYGNIWEDRLHFIEKGVHNAMPDIEAAMQRILNEYAMELVSGVE